MTAAKEEPVNTAPPPGGVPLAVAAPFAVIDIGTNAVRMVIAQSDAAGHVRVLDQLEQAVPLGRQVFTKGSVGRRVVEDCVRVLKRFGEVLREYQVGEIGQIRAVATSALREATNVEDIVDRIEIATGIQVEVIDEAEQNRLAYLGVLPAIHAEPDLKGKTVLALEVGGGGTEWLMLHDDTVLATHSFRLGSLRLRETLESINVPSNRLRKVLENHIESGIEQASKDFPLSQENLEMVSLGGDVCFAASQLEKNWPAGRMAPLSIAALSRFTDLVFGLSTDELVRKYRLTYPAAETLGPALLAVVLIARKLKLKHLRVTRATLRDGLMQEIAVPGVWAEHYRREVIGSSLGLGHRYNFDEAHCRHVAQLSSTLFTAFEDDHHLSSRFELILHIAALLHEIGLFVSNRSHHKHSQYLIQNSDLFGVSRRDLLLVALVARYHRRAMPRPIHEGYATLDRPSRIAVVKMAAILRVADALDRSHSQRVRNIAVRRDKDHVAILVSGVDDLAMEQLALEQKGEMFEQTFGLPIVLEVAPAPPGGNA